MTIPQVQWALDITRQSVLEYPFVPDEQQLQLLIPPRDGPANAPTFTAYDSLSRNYYLTTRATDYTGFVFGVTIAGDVNSTQYTFPKQSFKFPHARALMVGMETVTLGGAQIVLVFYADGAAFNKWKALELALDSYGRRGWLCVMDADVIWPQHGEMSILSFWSRH